MTPNSTGKVSSCRRSPTQQSTGLSHRGWVAGPARVLRDLARWGRSKLLLDALLLATVVAVGVVLSLIF